MSRENEVIDTELTKDELDYLAKHFYRHFRQDSTIEMLNDALYSKSMVCNSYYGKDGLVTNYELTSTSPSLKEVGARYGRGAERVRQWVARAFRIMRIQDGSFERWCLARPYKLIKDYQERVRGLKEITYKKISSLYLREESYEMYQLMCVLGEENFHLLFDYLNNNDLSIEIIKEYYDVKRRQGGQDIREVVRRAFESRGGDLPTSSVDLLGREAQLV
jgi:hypothetical protein